MVLKKSVAASAVVCLLVLGGSAAASAETQRASYPPDAQLIVSENPILVAFATGGSTSVAEPVIDTMATVPFSADSAGTYTVAVTGDTEGTDLPASGGTAPVAAIWLAVGAIGIGGIAIAAALARRRAYNGR